MNDEKVAIFVPTMGRPGVLGTVIENINVNTALPHSIYFIIESHDSATREACERLGANYIVNEKEPCYAGAINTAFLRTEEPYFFTGADDLNFMPRWLEEAMYQMNPPAHPIHVVGTNDMGSIPIGPERDSTHYLVRRKYIDRYGGVYKNPGMVLYPYKHNYTDKEFIETAKSWGFYAYAPESRVEHMHWAWGKASMDDTYRRGLATNEEDKQLYMSRRHLWMDN